MKIKNWNEFQHFKDRNPPWIKLHKKILDQRDIMMISDCSFRILVGFWLLAAEDENKEGALPSIEDIAFRLRKNPGEILAAIQELRPFLVFDDINAISTRYQFDAPETETETETETYREETETEDSAKPDEKSDFAPPPVDQSQKMLEVWNQQVQVKLTVGGGKAQMSVVRKQKLQKRLKENFAGELGKWQEYCQKIANTPFLTGTNDRGWRATIDWVLEPKNLAKIQEGAYQQGAVEQSGDWAKRRVEELRKLEEECQQMN